jgi:hypothetical protein
MPVTLKQFLLSILTIFALAAFTACGGEAPPDDGSIESTSAADYLDELEVETQTYELQTSCRGAGINCGGCDRNGQNCLRGASCSISCGPQYPGGASGEASCSNASCKRGLNGSRIAIDASCACFYR